MKKIKFVAILFLGLTVNLAVSSANWQAMVQQVTQLRAELESLHKESDVLQREKQTELDQWSQRKQEISMTLEKEKMRSLQINEKIKRLQAKVKHQGKSDPKASQKLILWIENLEKTVQSSLPFQKEKRISELLHLRQRVEKGLESPEFLLADIWSFVEAEMKLTQTNDYKIMNIVLAGKEQKAEVVRIGLQWMFALTPQGESYTMIKKATGWDWQSVESTQQPSVSLLVQDLRNKNDSGYYKLPRTGDIMGASL